MSSNALLYSRGARLRLRIATMIARWPNKWLRQKFTGADYAILWGGLASGLVDICMKWCLFTSFSSFRSCHHDGVEGGKGNAVNRQSEVMFAEVTIITKVAYCGDWPQDARRNLLHVIILFVYFFWLTVRFLKEWIQPWLEKRYKRG